MRIASLALLLSLHVAALSQAASTTQTSAPAEATTLEQARELLKTGEYDEAVAAFEQLATEPETELEAIIGLAEAWRQTGEYRRALFRIDVA